MAQKMESVSKNDAQGLAIKHQANVIGNADDQEERKGGAANFREFMVQHTARRANNKVLTMDNF